MNRATADKILNWVISTENSWWAERNLLKDRYLLLRVALFQTWHGSEF